MLLPRVSDVGSPADDIQWAAVLKSASALEMYRQLIDTEYGYSSAIGVILFIMSFIATVVILRYRRTETIERVA